MFINIKLLFKIIFIALLFSFTSYSNVPDTSNAAKSIYPVVFSGDTLFFIGTNIGPFTPQQRVSAIEQKLNTILDENKNPDLLDTEDVNNATNIRLGSEILMSLTDRDAEQMGLNRNELAKEYRDTIRYILKKDINLFSTTNLLISALKIFYCMHNNGLFILDYEKSLSQML